MSTNPFQSFVELISLDQDIRTIHHEMMRLQEETALYLAQKEEELNRLDQFKKYVHELRRAVDEQELELKDLDAQEKRQKEHIALIKNVKEHHALKKEADRIKQVQLEAESRLMQVWNKLEAAQKDLKDQQKIHDQKVDELHSFIMQKEEKIALLQEQLELKKSKRPDKEAVVPKDWLDKYTHMRMQVVNPVIPLEQGSCSACFYTVTDQELLRLKRRALINCKGCFRLIYAPEAMQNELEQVLHDDKK